MNPWLIILVPYFGRWPKWIDLFVGSCKWNRGMRWQSGRWMSDPPAPTEAAWLRLERIVHVDWRRAATEGFCISPEGFTSSPANAIRDQAPSR